MFSFYEFFAGGGMARAGLGNEWNCLFANDIDHKKSISYKSNWGEDVLKTCDVKDVRCQDLPGRANLIWASFPCQDLSLAGAGGGLNGERSGTFWPFWDVVRELISETRAPEVIVLENVCGTLTSHKGVDFVTICAAFQDAGYHFGTMVIDAALFVPQSRPRLFIIGVRDDIEVSSNLHVSSPTSLFTGYSSPEWHTRSLRNAYANLSPELRQTWIWWTMPTPPVRNITLAHIVEDSPASVSWHTPGETRRLLNMMSNINRIKIEQARKIGRRIVGTMYKRTRHDKDGVREQRAEIRFDGIAGCLRTPAGGSSRQIIMMVDGDNVQSRLISSRETARLMGLPDDYKLPENYNEAYHLTGDGVVVPVVRYISENIIEPLLKPNRKLARAAA